jgi:glyoxylase-like metal-dependent hydrolase (beta-lactamase superfamily II)
MDGGFSNPSVKVPKMLKIGDYLLHALPVQEFFFDGQRLTGAAQQRSRSFSPIHLSTRLLLIVGNGRRILVDAGLGRCCAASRWTEAALSPYGLYEQLSGFGLRPEDITDLILTHLHTDHAGGAFFFDGLTLQPVFPNARVIVQEGNFRAALRPGERERPSFDEGVIEALGALPLLHIVSGAVELFPGIELFVSNGHTRGQQLVRVSDSDTLLLHGGDLVPTSAHYARSRVTGNDVDALTLIEEKSALLQEAFEKGGIMFFGHDPLRHAATVFRASGGFAPGPAPEF